MIRKVSSIWMRRQKRGGLPAFAPHMQRETSQALLKFGLLKEVCVLNGTTLAGATFWHGYDSYQSRKDASYDISKGANYRLSLKSAAFILPTTA